MNEISEDNKACCPFCGFSRAGYNPPEGALQPEDFFENRYYVGRAYKNDPAGTSYIVLDTVMGRKSVLRLMSDGSKGSSAHRQKAEAGFRLYERREKFLSAYKKIAATEVSALPVIYTCNTTASTAYAVCEFISDITLPMFLEQTGGKTFEGAKKYLLSVIVALKLLHDNGIVHGQLTPDCIRKTDKTFVLCDIGAVSSSEKELLPEADIKAFLLIFISTMYGSPFMADASIINKGFLSKNELELPEEAIKYIFDVFNGGGDTEISAGKILEVFYHSSSIAVLRPKTVPAVSNQLLETVQKSGVPVTQLITSLV